jgi:hypothetical protein
MLDPEHIINWVRLCSSSVIKPATMKAKGALLVETNQIPN